MTTLDEPHRFDSSFVPVRRGELLSREVDDELVIVNPTSGSGHILNNVAVAVWSLIDGTRDVGSIVRELSDETGAEEATVRADVIRFLRSLAQAGLLVR